MTPNRAWVVLLMLLFLLIGKTSYSQIDVTSVGASYYFVVVEGDTISQHTTLHRAFVSAVNSMHPNPQIVQDYRLNFEIDDWSYFIDPEIEVVYDTIYVEPDTVFVEIRDTVFVEVADTVFVEGGDTVYVDVVDTVFVQVPIEVPGDTLIIERRSESDLLYEVNWEHILTEGGSQEIVIESESYGSFTDFSYWCDGSQVMWNSNPESPGHNELWQEDSQGERVGFKTIAHPEGMARDTLRMECLDTVQFTVYTYSSRDGGGYRAGYLGEIPVHLFRDDDTYFTNFTEYNPEEWEVIWGNMQFYVNDEKLFIEQPQSIARLRWNRIPSHKNARVRIVEELHESHTTGLHSSLRTSGSPSPRRGVESFVNLNGFGVSYFLDGAWRNPATAPFDWENGDLVEYILDLNEDTVRIKIWNHEEGEEPEEWFEFSHDEIGEIIEGFFAFGATGAGTYILHEVEVTIYE